MDIKEFYNSINSNYGEVFDRIPDDNFILKFVLKFMNDESFTNLKKAFEEKNVEEAFRAAHTLKGVCANLGFNQLFEVSKELTDVLRKKSFDGSNELYQKVCDEYQKVIDGIKQIQ